MTYTKKQISLIEKTNNPVMPLIFNEYIKGVNNMAKSISHLCDKQKVTELQARLLKDFKDEELDAPDGILAGNPEFLLAILAMAYETGIDFLNKPNKTK